MLALRQPPPLSLYVHIPWCLQKCPYCDFNSHPVRRTIPEERYINALVDDLELVLPQIWGRPLSSIFIGGGTPSLFSPAAIEKLLSEFRARLRFINPIEITLEANPGTVDKIRLQEYRHAGINRLSLGIQSFDSSLLSRIGRIHDGRQAITAVEAARQAGYHNFNLDLMYGLPGQTTEDAVRDINTAVGFAATHISFYQLTLEPNTGFFHYPPQLPDENTVWHLQEQCLAILAEHDYERYEVSAFARSNRRCRHNLNYWQFGDYVGIGAGAHSKISNQAEQNITREWKIKHPEHYLAANRKTGFVAGQQRLERADIIAEFMMNALRLTEGFCIEQFTAATGLPGTAITTMLVMAEARHLIVRQPRIRTTSLGFRFLNELLELFLPDTGSRAASGDLS